MIKNGKHNKKVKNKKITCILASIAKHKKKPEIRVYFTFFSLINFIKKYKNNKIKNIDNASDLIKKSSS